MKRTCYGCKAFEEGIFESQCSIGYSVHTITRTVKGSEWISNVKPKEECPKPTTNKDLVRCKHKNR